MKILIATDGSEFSRKAVEKCRDMIVKPGETQIKIVTAYQIYVYLNMNPDSIHHSKEIERSIYKEAEKHATDAAEILRKSFPEESVEITTLAAEDSPDRAIIKAAEKWNADLIVVGSYGRGFWGRMLVGSVSDAVVHHAPCSVLVVRDDRPASGDVDSDDSD